ncbi:MAG: hypothetical protein V3581_02660 [Candidatus Cardinium sp.]|uniref:hypothetical protein n=1 Tax=Candidatus Cardinium sp. TP TaxID=2961955 RepID=UPI0021AF7343|nr:hypothetical protein [Candidatus Cardinium sp. TP]MCT4697177.1 hypothetical protein [Candidatus Cardinium sp. TP]MDN5247091.1 hypothetical protein [Candidatus Cardinium sp.]
MDTSEEDPIIYVAEDTFGKAIEIIQPKCREGIKSAWRSIDTQAKEVIQEIQKTLSCKFPQYSEKELKALPIHLFGYSQGGLVAGIIAADYRDALNIKSLALAHVPLSGTDVLKNTKSSINEFNKQAKPGLEAIGYHTKSFFEKNRKKASSQHTQRKVEQHWQPL